MNTPKHTPGEWSANLNDIRERVNNLPILEVSTVHPEETQKLPEWIAKVRGNNKEERQANAHLIAAAPQMLEALNYCAATFAEMAKEDSGNTIAIKAMKTVMRAIKSATT